MRSRSASNPSYRQLFGVLARGRRARLAGLGLLLAASSALPLAGPQLLRVFIDEVASGRWSALWWLVGAYLLVSVIQQVVSVGSVYGATHLSWRVTNALRTKVTRHILDLDLSFHDSRTPGEMIERTDGDITALSSFVSTFAVQMISSVLTLSGVLVLVLIEDWRVGLGLAGFVAVAGVTLVRLRHAAVPRAAERRAASATLFGEIEERLSGAEDLRANGGGAHALGRFQRAQDALLRASARAAVATRSIYVITLAVFAVGSACSLGAGTALFHSGAITLGTVYLLFRYTTLLRDPLEQISSQVQKAQEAIAGFTRVQELLNESPSIGDDGRATIPSGPLSVELKRVRFAYREGVPVLDDIDLYLKPGSVLGVAGRTGSGKTSLVRLMLRLADPSGGVVRLGGVDLREARLNSLRGSVGLVTQNVQLFDASVRDNLTLFGAQPATDARLVEVLQQLQLGPWYRALPDGLDTMVGIGAAGVSAGEAQLVAFARVFLRDPGLVILDEATSRLDPVSEARIERAVDTLIEGRTAILIAHRLATLDRADEIAVLSRGRIVEHGCREDLTTDPSSRFAQLLTTAGGAAR
ncbi:ABC transporter ATP-binding protein [Nonomuraea sp. NPDC059007]|uniref:ABC transporter ATP-binding protein n=1 Tax=Nonomuraea sp. NPDC059007 TaxID=3346692 RepID=UPI0036BC6999